MAVPVSEVKVDTHSMPADPRPLNSRTRYSIFAADTYDPFEGKEPAEEENDDEDDEGGEDDEERDEAAEKDTSFAADRSISFLIVSILLCNVAASLKLASFIPPE
jgi:hypothetical protein